MSRRVLVEAAGGPEVLRLVEAAPPSPSRGAVRVRVHTAGVAFGDVMRRRGVLAPRTAFTPGYDVVGVIEELGAGVAEAEHPLGKRVAAFMPGPGLGGYADHVCVPAKELVPVPDALSDETAVALGLNYITARQLLTRIAPVQEGQRLLVHGAAGGVGTAVLDLGRRLGVELVGTASKAKHHHLETRGCEAIDYRSEEFERVLKGRPVDVALDPIGGSHLRRTYETLGPRGRLVAFGVSGDLGSGYRGVVAGMTHWLALKLRPDSKRVSLYNITISSGASRAHCRSDWQHLMDAAVRGELEPVIGAVVRLSEVRGAHELMDGGGVIGKVVLRCKEDV
ncbi:MAG: zinc-binding dehydrogenase [Deltaproteobacteria bacterium]|nr:zinc-binding dehydrogenase [Deltaproteobacteria bacterium]